MYHRGHSLPRSTAPCQSGSTLVRVFFPHRPIGNIQLTEGECNPASRALIRRPKIDASPSILDSCLPEASRTTNVCLVVFPGRNDWRSRLHTYHCEVMR